MKRTITLVILLLTLVGTLSTPVLADGGGGPSCNPLTDPNCKIVTSFTAVAQ